MSDNNFSPFDYPIIKELIVQLLKKLPGESGRGAILISATHVEDFLFRLIKDILPSKEKKYLGRLFNYPGSLSSFSSKIELSYAFRLINKNLYDSLNALRKIRNDAAHSSSPFSLEELIDKVKPIFEIGPNSSNYVRNSAMELMMHFKMEGVKEAFNSTNLTEDENRSIWEEIINDKDTLASLEKQLPHWELVFGISLICGIIENQRVKTISVLNGRHTWSSIVSESKTKNGA